MNQHILRPGDVVVAIQAALKPAKSLGELAVASARSIGEVHNAIRRLRAASLIEPDGRGVDRESLVQFIRWGVPVAFPAMIGSETVGFGTAKLAVSPGDDLVPAGDFEFVWPDSEGEARGVSLVPLHPRVTKIAIGNTKLFTALAAVDLVRVGGIRERTAAVDRLRQLLGMSGQHG